MSAQVTGLLTAPVPPPMLSLSQLANTLLGTTLGLPPHGHSTWNAEQSLKWERVTLSKLAKWERDPSGLIEAEMAPPTAAAGRGVRDFGGLLNAIGGPPPGLAVPDGDGGVSLEWRDASGSLAVRVDQDGRVEIFFMADMSAVKRGPLSPIYC